MLFNNGAFTGYPALKFAIKHIIEEGFWNEAAQLFNEISGSFSLDSVRLTEDLKARIHHHFGFSDKLIGSIIDSIQFVDDWDWSVGPTDLDQHARFEGIPIRGTTYDFVRQLLHKGYNWDAENDVAIGNVHGINCQVKCSQSSPCVPIYEVMLFLPESVSLEAAQSLVKKLYEQQTDAFMTSPYAYTYIRLNESHKVGQRFIFIRDPWGFDVMVDSPFFPPRGNHLQTIE